MFFRLHFKCHFWQDFLNFWSHFGVHLAPFSRKKLFRKWLRKKRPHTWKLLTMNVSGGSQRGRLACALLKQETTVRAQNAVRICFHSFFSKLKSNMLFELASIANVLTKFSKKCNVKSTSLMIWHALGQRPGEFCVSIQNDRKQIYKTRVDLCM